MQTSSAELKLNSFWLTSKLDPPQRKFYLALRVIWTFSRSSFPFRVHILCDILFLIGWLSLGHSPLTCSVLFTALAPRQGVKGLWNVIWPGRTTSVFRGGWLPVPEADWREPWPGCLKVHHQGGVWLLPQLQRLLCHFWVILQHLSTSFTHLHVYHHTFFSDPFLHLFFYR